MTRRTLTRDDLLEPDLELMDRGDLRALQLERIRSLVERATARSGLYRELWAGVAPPRSIEEFQTTTPLLDKRHLVAYRDREADPFAGILLGEASDISTIGTTSGTTAEAMPLVEHLAGRPPFHTVMRDMWAAGLRPGDRVVPVGVVRGGPQERVYQAIGCVPLMLNLRPGTDWDAVFEAFAVHRPAHIYITGPTITELDRLADERDLRGVFSCLKFAVFSGEPLGSRMRARIVDDWGLDLYDVTSAGDTGLAWDCPMHDGYHLWEDHVFAEVVDPVTGEPVADGQIGELVCTSLTNSMWPLIRYRSGDLVRMSSAPCECGRTHARYWLIGRVSDQLRIGDRTFVPGDVWRVIEAHDETSTGVFQIVNPAADGILRIRVGYAARRTASVPDLERRLVAAICDAVGVAPVLTLMPDTELLAGSTSGIKLPRIVTR